jgi:hypothetical protein
MVYNPPKQVGEIGYNKMCVEISNVHLVGVLKFITVFTRAKPILSANSHLISVKSTSILSFHLQLRLRVVSILQISTSKPSMHVSPSPYAYVRAIWPAHLGFLNAITLIGLMFVEKHLFANTSSLSSSSRVDQLGRCAYLPKLTKSDVLQMVDKT